AFAGKDAQQVSWEHARIDLTPQGARVSDLKSTNGTYVNGQRLQQPAALQVGDQVRLGQTGPTLKVMALDLSEAAPRVKPPPAPAKARPPGPDRPPHPHHHGHKGGRNVSVMTSMTRRLVAGLQRRTREVIIASAVCVVLLAAGFGVTIYYVVYNVPPRPTDVV